MNFNNSLMATILLAVLVVLALVNATTTYLAANLAQTATGFYFPLNKTFDNDGNWGYCGADYYANTRHTGTDCFYASGNENNVGRPVYAVSDGVVHLKSGPGECSGWGIGNYALVIKHQSTTQNFIAVYGHIQTTLNSGDRVTAGQQIGTIGSYTEHQNYNFKTCKQAGQIITRSAHLHFGIFPSWNNFPSSSWGRVSDDRCDTPNWMNGFIAPMTYLKTHTPLNGNPTPTPTPTVSPIPSPTISPTPTATPTSTPTPTPTPPTTNRPSLAVIKKNLTGSGWTEVHILSGANTFQSFAANIVTAQHMTSDEYVFRMADWNGDGRPDLFGIKKYSSGTGKTEVHILSGSGNYQTFLLQTGTAQPQTSSDYDFQLGDYNLDGKIDLYVIKKFGTGTGKTEVHILSGASNFQTFLLNTGTAQEQTGDNYDFALGDYNRDGRLDLFVIKKYNTGSGVTEVHVLSGNGNFQQFLANIATAQPQTGAEHTYLVGDWDGDNRPDLFAVKKYNTGTGKLEVHVLTGSSNYQQYLLHTGTVQEPTLNYYDFALVKW